MVDVRKEGTETEINKIDGNVSLTMDLTFDLADRAVMLKLGRTNDGGYADTGNY